jgi:large conductance mechanosensitive channel
MAGIDLSGLEFVIGKAEIKYGMFLSQLIDFLIIVLVIYVVVKLAISKMLSEKERADLGM